MMKFGFRKRNSIVFKLTMVFVMAMLLQCVLMAGILIFGGVIEQTQDNAFHLFAEKVSRRKNDLENEMKNRWTNLDHYSMQLSHYFTERCMDKNVGDMDGNELLKGAAPYLVDALRAAKTTGVFLILNDNAENSALHSALYIRNSAPNQNNNDISDLSLLAGPWNVAQSMRMSTDPKWNIRLLLNEENGDFYRKPYEKIALTNHNQLLGYWSAPFSLFPGDEKIITYSMPLTDEQGRPIGVFGVEISINHLYKFLPATDLQEQDSYGYIIGRRTAADTSIAPIVTRGALQARMLRLAEPLLLTAVSKESDVYKVHNHNSSNELYACVDKLGLYYNNTPFEQEEWFLIGMMEDSVLLQLPQQISHILIFSFLVSLSAGIAIALVVSRRFTRPIIDLARQLERHVPGEVQLLGNTGLAEIDALSATINYAQKRLLDFSTKLSRVIELTQIPFGAFEISQAEDAVFMTKNLPQLFCWTPEEAEALRRDKRKFNARLQDICWVGADYPGVFRVAGTAGDRWIRLMQTQTEEAVLGVALDVTDEVLRESHLKVERDRDPLTGIDNRNAFNRRLAACESHIAEQPAIGLGMFDLNGLKYVNDCYGHSQGDAYICRCAALLQATFSGCSLFRIGGDEFAAIFIAMEAAEIERRHQELLVKVKGYNEEIEFTAGIAFGYAFYDSIGDVGLEGVLARADDAMYSDKKELKSLNKKL